MIFHTFMDEFKVLEAVSDGFPREPDAKHTTIIMAGGGSLYCAAVWINIIKTARRGVFAGLLVAAPNQ